MCSWCACFKCDDIEVYTSQVIVPVPALFFAHSEQHMNRTGIAFSFHCIKLLLQAKKLGICSSWRSCGLHMLLQSFKVTVENCTFLATKIASPTVAKFSLISLSSSYGRGGHSQGYGSNCCFFKKHCSEQFKRSAWPLDHFLPTLPAQYGIKRCPCESQVMEVHKHKNDWRLRSIHLKDDQSIREYVQMLQLLCFKCFCCEQLKWNNVKRISGTLCHKS